MGISSNKHTLLPNDAVLQQMKNLRHLPDQNLNFGGAWRVTTEKALKDIYSVKCRENNTYIVQAKPKSKIYYYSLYQYMPLLHQKNNYYFYLPILQTNSHNYFYNIRIEQHN